jgi:hypothetical protein
MRTARTAASIFTAALAFVGLSGTAYAFHMGGVAECNGCHSMHSPAPAGSYLLIGSDPSSTCLDCHQNAGDTGPSSYHISTADASLGAGQAPLQKTPGGDFGWLKKTFTYTLRGTLTTEAGQKHGHNIVAADFGYVVDPDNAEAPGGTFPSAQLSCVSCHDPHGQYRRLSDGTISRTGGAIIASGSYDNSPVPAAGQAVGVYRLLAGAGYTVDGVTFNGVPSAVVPSTYNRTEATTQTRVAYGSVTTSGHETWGNWCGTCHPGMHSDGNYVHPIDESMGSEIKNIYDQYRGSGIMTGTATDSFLSLVPFVENSGSTYATLATHAKNNNSQLGGPANNDQVSCLSCHRAHATGFVEGLRWNMEGELIIVNGSWPGTDAPQTAAQDPKWSQGRTYAEMKAAYYDYPESKFGSYQRVLCNKCHAKD